MQIILLDETRFDNFAINHPNYNYFQTSNYGKLMTKHGFNAYYLGLVNDLSEIKAATLMLVKNEKNNKRKAGYTPRGFLINWQDEILVKEFTEALKEFLAKRSFTYLSIDPAVIYKEHDIYGNDKQGGESHESFVKWFQSLGYIHMGFNNGTETLNPRWNALTMLNNNIISLYNSISKEARNKIDEAYRYGYKVYKGSINDINSLYNLIKKPTPPIDFYLDLYQFYGQNSGCEVYFSKLEPVSYVNSSKNMFEREEQINNDLNNQMQDWNNPNKNNTINEKLKSDERLAKYKKNMLDAINLFQKYPNGLITAAVMVIKHGKTAYFVASGTDEQFKDQHSEYLLKWQLIQEFAKQGYQAIDYDGINGDFKEDYDNKVKLELSNKIVEYVGEFHLVINKKSYYTGSKLSPILNWLNTPI